MNLQWKQKRVLITLKSIRMVNPGLLSFRAQLSLAFLTVSLLVITLISTAAYVQAIHVLKSDFMVQTDSLFHRTKDELITKFDNVEKTLKLISTDQRLQGANDPQSGVSNRDLTKLFMDAIDLNNYQESAGNQRIYKNLIDDLIFINDHRVIISRREHFSVYGIQSYLPDSLLEQARDAKGKVVWSDIFFNRLGARLCSGLPSATQRESLNQMAIVKYVTHERFKTPVGYLIASINLARLSDVLEGINLGKTGQVFIVDGRSRVLASRDKSLIYRRIPLDPNGLRLLNGSSGVNAEGRFRGEPCFVYTVDIGMNHWKLVGIVRSREFHEQARIVRDRILVSSLLVLLLFILAGSVVANRITRPLQNICTFLQKIESGDLCLRTHEAGSAEIVNLSHQLNQMIERISQLLEEVYEEQLFKRKAALKALHAQINPHFLYNTLDSISWMIESGQRETAVGLIASLTTFFRIGLSGGRDIITLEEELKHAESYLMIQKTRYSNRLDYLFNVEEELKNVGILKITLQPLIENAIYHGLKPKSEGTGIIYVNGERYEKDKIRITVVDNGIGMSEERLNELNEDMEETNLDVTTDGKGYGLKNINTRIKLYFGNEYGLRFYSRPGVGTRVEIILPFAPSVKGEG